MRKFSSLIFIVIVASITACSSSSDETGGADTSADGSSVSEDSGLSQNTDSSSPDGNSPSSTPTPEECMQINTEKTCRNRGCSDFIPARFGVIDNGECQMNQNNFERHACLIRKGYTGGPVSQDSAEETWAKKTPASQYDYRVMHLAAGPEPLQGGWKTCNNMFPTKDNCGCDVYQ